MLKMTGAVVNYPARAACIGYGLLIGCGTLALMHPWCRNPERSPISAVDALFTATSAACVTGLSVRSTGQDFSFLGQLLILILAQIGGIGILTFSTLILLQFGGRENLRSRAIAADTLVGGHKGQIHSLFWRVLSFTFICEMIGCFCLLPSCLQRQNLGPALWESYFHSVMAFCNAGFSLHDDSLVRYQHDWMLNLTVCALIIIGGIGFPVILDFQSPRPARRTRWEHWSLHTKLMLLGTGFLLVAGTLGFMTLEWNNSLRDKPWDDKLLISFFQATTCRTAGFNTIDLTSLTNATLFLMVVLMFIGAGPCSTGGGAKVSTILVLTLHAWSRFRGQLHVSVFRRTLPQETIERAITSFALFALAVIVGVAFLLISETGPEPYHQARPQLIDVLYETVSALATVGLTTGLTGNLSDAGRIFVSFLMFVGRLGPVTLAILFAQQQRHRRLAYAQEELLVG